MKVSFLDIETTGLEPQNSFIVEVAVATIETYPDEMEKVTYYSTLIRPPISMKNPIAIEASRINGITDHMLSLAPTFIKVANRIKEETMGSILVIHNAEFDYPFLQNAFLRINEVYQRPTVCTLKLSRAIYPGLRSHSLGYLCKQLKLDNPQAHRALGDTVTTMSIMNHLIKQNPIRSMKAFDRVKGGRL